LASFKDGQFADMLWGGCDIKRRKPSLRSAPLKKDWFLDFGNKYQWEFI